jgi:hypothetical protein
VIDVGRFVNEFDSNRNSSLFSSFDVSTLVLTVRATFVAVELTFVLRVTNASNCRITLNLKVAFPIGEKALCAETALINNATIATSDIILIFFILVLSLFFGWTVNGSNALHQKFSNRLKGDSEIADGRSRTIPE